MPTSRRRKYRNIKVVSDGVTFDSKLELKRWKELVLLERAGEIGMLERQVPYRLEVNGMLVCRMVVDFRYQQGTETVLEDTKSPSTARERSYRIKKKLLKALTGLDIVEVFK